MTTEALLSSRPASRVFFRLTRKRARSDLLAKSLKMKKGELTSQLERMQRAGLLDLKRGTWGVDWERFLPLFLRQAMNIYSAAMPWKFIPIYMEKGEQDFIEASCARAERELARVKVKLAGNDLFFRIVQSYYQILANEALAPDEYLEDLRISDSIDEFEYALLKLLPLIRRQKRTTPESKQLFRLLGDWYRRIQEYDTPTGTALRAAFQEHNLV